MAKINGKIVSSADEMTLSEFIEREGYGKRIAVEYNGEILPKSEYDSRIILLDDEIEIVEFMGGG
ncbi:MAG: sulfur carrier protein ThiS [Oscillospiraceae bacterium]|nr:sulfur carrier protein ThiS [Oscillospiraceae bacterium]